jgi:transposase
MALIRQCCRGFSRFWSGHDPDAKQCSGVAGDRSHRHEEGFASLSLLVQEVLRRDPLGGQLFCFRGRSGNLLKVIWHDGQGACLFVKRLERGRFLWPSPADGAVTISPAQLGYLLSGIDWRNPQETWRPTSVG